MYQQWKPTAVGAVFGAAEAFAIDMVSADHPEWRWSNLDAVWGFFCQDNDRSRASARNHCRNHDV